jgi:hypothetical protein
MLAVADWWLGTMVAVLGATAAAAAPATTMDRAKTRKTSFMAVTPLRIELTGRFSPCTLRIVVNSLE